MAVIKGINRDTPLLDIDMDASTNRGTVRVTGVVVLDPNNLAVLESNPNAKFNLVVRLFGLDNGLRRDDDPIPGGAVGSKTIQGKQQSAQVGFDFTATRSGAALNEDRPGSDEIYARCELSNNAGFLPVQEESNIIEFAFRD